MADSPELKVLYEDDAVLAVDKPAGLAVHLSETGREQPTVADFARARSVQDEDDERPGIVHRLDKDTSGVLLVAKNQAAKKNLQSQFRKRLVKKVYLALVVGHPEPPEAQIRLPVGRDLHQPTKRAVVAGGREAVTHYRTLNRFKGFSLLEVRPETGRTHQIRVHLAKLGYPIAGDQLYGGRSLPALNRQFLHASELSFASVKGNTVTVKSPLPTDLELALNSLEV